MSPSGRKFDFSSNRNASSYLHDIFAADACVMRSGAAGRPDRGLPRELHAEGRRVAPVFRRLAADCCARQLLTVVVVLATFGFQWTCACARLSAVRF